MALKDRIKEIQKEYLQYQYIENAPKSGSNSFLEMLNQVYERKQILSDILNAQKNNTLDAEEKALTERLAKSDAYFSNLYSNEKKQWEIESLLEKAPDEVKGKPEYHIYRMIYMERMSSLKMKELYPDVFKEYEKVQEKRKVADERYYEIKKLTDEKTLHDGLVRREEIRKGIKELKDKITDIDEMLKKLDIEEKKLSNQSEHELFNVEIQEVMNAKIATDGVELRKRYLSEAEQDIEAYNEKRPKVDAYKAECKAYEKVVEEYDAKKERYASLDIEIEEAEKKFERISNGKEMKALMIYEKMREGRYDIVNVIASRFEKIEDKLKNILDEPLSKLDEETRNDYAVTQFIEEEWYQFSQEERENLTIRDLKDLVQGLNKKFKEYCDFETFRNLDDVWNELDVDENTNLEHLKAGLSRLNIRTKDELAGLELKDFSDEKLKEAISEDIRKKMKELDGEIEKGKEELEKKIPEKDFYDQFQTKKEELLEEKKQLEIFLKTNEKVHETMDQMKEKLNGMENDINWLKGSAERRIRGLCEYCKLEGYENATMEDLKGIKPQLVSKIEEYKVKAEKNLKNKEKALEDAKAGRVESAEKRAKLRQELLENKKEYEEKIPKMKQELKNAFEDEKVSEAVNKFVEAKRELTEAKQEAINAISNTIRVKLASLQKQAEVFINSAELYQGGHKNSDEYDLMMYALGGFAHTKLLGPDVPLHGLIKAVREKTQEYLDAKNGQRRWFPTKLRRTRMTMANSINLLMDEVDKVLELETELENIQKDATNKETELEKIENKVIDQQLDERMADPMQL